MENVAFGLRARGVDKRVARERSTAALERLGVGKVAEARPGNMTDVRRQLRATLRESQAANVMVTHDLLDAVALADRTFVIEDAGIARSGTPAEVTPRPRSRYVADLVGVNLLRGTACGASPDVDGGGHLVTGEEMSGPVLAAVAPTTSA